MASGGAALVYEVVWVKLLSIAFGSTTLSLAIVTSIFFFGMAGGAWIGAAKADQQRRPLLVFAALETVIAAFAPITLYLFELAPVSYRLLGSDPGLFSLLALKALLTLAILIAPALAMGATLPLAAAAVDRQQRAGLSAASLYSANTFGAVAGTLLVGLVLIASVGMLGALIAGAALDLTAALLAVVADRKLHRAQAPLALRADPTAPPALVAGPWLIPVVAGIGGLAGMAYEVAYTRVLHVVMASTVETVAVVLAAFLSGIALGAAGYRAWGRRWRMDLSRLSWLLVLSALGALVVTLAFEPLAYQCRALASRGGLWSALQRFGWAAAVLLPPAALNGAIFPAVVDLSAERMAGRAVGRMLGFNTVGSVIGSLLAGTLLIPRVGTTATLYLVTALVLVAALVCGYLAQRRTLAALVLASFVGIGALWPGVDLARIAQLRNTAAGSYAATRAALDTSMRAAVYTAEGATGVVMLSEEPAGTWIMRLDGLTQAIRTQTAPRFGLESVLLATIPAALARGDQHALVIGLGGGVTVEALQAIGTARIDVVELEPRVVEAYRRLPGDASRALDQPGVTLTIVDGREFLQRPRPANGYDVIASQPSHWWIAGVGNLATLEFYQLVHAALADGGVFCQWINGARMTEQAIRGVVGAMQQVFAETLVIAVGSGGLYYLVGVRGALQPDRALVAQRLAQPAVQALAADSPRDLDDLAALIVHSGRVPSGAPRPPNRDRDALVESSLAAAGAADELDLAALAPPLLDRPGPPPALLPTAALAEQAFWLEAAERRFNTPAGVPLLIADGLDGLLPFGPVAPALAQLAVAAARPHLDDCWQRYLDARLQLVRGRLIASRDALAQVCPGQTTHPAAQRGARFAALLDRDIGRCQSGLELLLEADASAPLDRYLIGLLRLCLGQDPAADLRAALVGWRESALPGVAMQWAAARGEAIPDSLLARASARSVIDVAALQASLAAELQAGRPASAATGERAHRLAQLLEQRVVLLVNRVRRLEQAGDVERAAAQQVRLQALLHELPPSPASR